MDPWIEGLRIALPRTGTAAQVYYQGCSDPVLAAELEDALVAGSTYVDIGAHVGEYVLRAARKAGPDARIHALEPNPNLATVIRRNVELNRLENVSVHALAVGPESMQLGFWEDGRSHGGWLAPATSSTYTVACMTLDQFAADQALGSIDVTKIDAAGAEAGVLKGAQELIREGRLPYVLAKLYNRATVRERFGHDSLDLIDLFLENGYRIDALVPGSRLVIRNRADAEEAGRSAYSVVLVARPRD